MTLDPRFDRLRRDAFAAFRPPAKLALSDWIEGHVYLPSAIAAQPGRMRLWPPQREIADAIGEESVERVSILKSARVGATQLMVGALGHFVQNDPAPVLAVVPAEADARHLIVSVVEPTFAESPALRAALAADTAGRDTMLHRQFAGGSLTVVSAHAPRNLRARTARVLFADEIDAYELSAGTEGDPVELAMRRTMTFGNRKIVLASTPVDAETSRIVRAYEQSDMRVFEVPCPSCGTFGEILWKDIRWAADKPETAHWRCPACEAEVADRQKPQMVEQGRWRATRPEVEGHRGYKLTSLTSTLPNATWPRLAAEFLQAKRSPTTLKPWLNTVLGEPWRGEGDDLDGTDFAALQRPFGLDRIPAEALVLTVGADVQADRIEATFAGWTKDGDVRVLGHETVWGAPTENETWAELDDLSRRQFRHPAGGVLTVDAAVIDSGQLGRRGLCLLPPPHVAPRARREGRRRLQPSEPRVQHLAGHSPCPDRYRRGEAGPAPADRPRRNDPLQQRPVRRLLRPAPRRAACDEVQPGPPRAPLGSGLGPPQRSPRHVGLRLRRPRADRGGRRAAGSGVGEGDGAAEASYRSEKQVAVVVRRARP
ncbi:Bacteriophage tail assembly protein [Wenxinia marina DSM 24838]|uniref:Bacteriophage tail assembly protein n=1 Tax=Wenxinia marina DSM 24838 TaxID=1123501 RepID=A0A0D0Q7Y7_9RHOB|nr:Bacteriophage tail assembly protein [Wenxinia marina DSM 24838]